VHELRAAREDVPVVDDEQLTTSGRENGSASVVENERRRAQGLEGFPIPGRGRLQTALESTSGSGGVSACPAFLISKR
jgi:hypothetical protein